MKKKSQNFNTKFKFFLWVFILLLACIPIPFIYNSCGEGGKLQFSRILLSLEGNFSIEINQGEFYTNKKEVQLNLKVPSLDEKQENLKYEISISNTSDCSEGEWEPFLSTKKWLLEPKEEIEEKEHTVSVKFREERKKNIHYVYDSQEAESQQAETACFSKSVFYDNKAPQVILTSYPSKKSNQASTELTFSVKDTSSPQAECKLNEGNWKECFESWSEENLIEGEYTFSIRARDLSGNLTEIPPYSWEIDLEAPSFNLIKTPPNKISNETSTSIELEISGGSFTNLFYYRGTDPNGIPDISLIEEHSEGKMNFSFPFHSPPGRSYFIVQGTDAFQNENSSRTSWLIDRTPPNTQFLNTPSHYFFDSSTIPFEVSATDNEDIKNIYFKLDTKNPSGNWDEGVQRHCHFLPSRSHTQKCTKTFTSGQLGQGEHRISFISEDKAGNPSSPLSHTFDVTFTPVLKTQWLQVLTTTSFQGSVDILFVVDDSGSMKDEQSELANSFPGFITGLQNVDWRIAFITTDNSARSRGSSKGPSGLFVPVADSQNKYFLTSSSSPPSLAVQGTQQLFQKTIESIGTDGSGTETGITTAHKALTKYKNCQSSPTSSDCTNSQKSQPHKEFFRPDAALSIIFISDENDAGSISSDSFKNDIENTFFQSNKKFEAHAILGNVGTQIDDLSQIRNGCDDSTNPNIRGPSKYLALSRLTEGKVMNINIRPYANCLEIIGGEIVESVEGLQLDCLPVDGDSDGTIDEPMIKHNSNPDATNTATYRPFNQRKTRAGTSLSFNDPLPAGRYKITYSCAP